MNFYRNFLMMRKKEGFTQEKMAEIFGVSRGAVAKWESGECIPNIELVCRIAEYFNITVDELVLGKKYTNSEITLEQPIAIRMTISVRCIHTIYISLQLYKW